MKPNDRRGKSFPVPMARSMPKTSGFSIVLPNESTRSVLRNQIASMPEREREGHDAERQTAQSQRGEPDERRPTTAAAVAASSGAMGKGTPQSTER